MKLIIDISEDELTDEEIAEALRIAEVNFSDVTKISDETYKMMCCCMSDKMDGVTDKQKYWYSVGLSAEGDSTGYVYLTKEEAKIVKYATNESNWKNAEIESWSGCFSIDIDNPKEQLPKEESD